ncbi:MAG: high-affinity nickel-transport family protein [Gemmatimonadetes bacterium]|nr:high-affinity nickel-transport family protein [Gemmatimonadota bacterium]
MLQDPLTAIALGALLGLRHATDSDHVVAVTAIVSRERSLGRAAGVGALWGIGHTLTLLVVGGAIVTFRLVIPPRVGLALEFGVALMLVVLGFTNLRARDDAPRAAVRPFLVGLVHGLAGSAAVSLLVLATIRGTFDALIYLFVFGLGTIIGMMAVTMLLAAPTLFAGARVTRFRSGIRVAAGALSIAFGLMLARELIVDGGLFAAVPTWAPR